MGVFVDAHDLSGWEIERHQITVKRMIVRMHHQCAFGLAGMVRLEKRREIHLHQDIGVFQKGTRKSLASAGLYGPQATCP